MFKAPGKAGREGRLLRSSMAVLLGRCYSESSDAAMQPPLGLEALP
jgi:hypothetical protein